MEEEVAESWEEAADSEVNNERLIIPSDKGEHLCGSFNKFTCLFLEVPITLFHVNDSHGPTMWLKLALALRNLTS